MSDGRKCARRLPHFCIGWAARSLAGRGRRARRSFCASGRKFPCAAPSCPVSSFLAFGRGRRRKASAGVAELADAYGSGPYGGNPMKVQVLSPAPLVSPLKPQVKGLGFLLLAGGSPSSPVWGRWRHREQTPAPARIRGMSDGRLACAFNRPLRPPHEIHRLNWRYITPASHGHDLRHDRPRPDRPTSWRNKPSLAVVSHAPGECEDRCEGRPSRLPRSKTERSSSQTKRRHKRRRKPLKATSRAGSSLPRENRSRLLPAGTHRRRSIPRTSCRAA